MNWREITNAYYERFEESIGVPFNGFPNEEVEKEFLQAVQDCVEKGEPLTVEQRKHFFPSEFEDVPTDELI